MFEDTKGDTYEYRIRIEHSVVRGEDRERFSEFIPLPYDRREDKWGEPINEEAAEWELAQVDETFKRRGWNNWGEPDTHIAIACLQRRYIAVFEDWERPVE